MYLHFYMWYECLVSKEVIEKDKGLQHVPKSRENFQGHKKAVQGAFFFASTLSSVAKNLNIHCWCKFMSDSAYSPQSQSQNEQLS